MALGRVRPLCMEDIPEGGLYTALGPTEVNPKTDAVDAAGFYVQSPTGPTGGDTSVLYGRSGSVAQVTDTSGSLTLGQTVSVSAASGGSQHPALVDTAHFLGGPAEGFTSGATQVVSYVTGTPLVATSIWYTSNTLATMIYSEVYTYSGPSPASAVFTTYNSSGSPVAKITETYSTSAGMITQTVRTH